MCCTTDEERTKLVQSLLFHAKRMEEEGHLNAARYMLNAADEIAFLRYEVMIKDKRLAKEDNQ
jgi:hypothetical protein